MKSRSFSRGRLIAVTLMAGAAASGLASTTALAERSPVLRQINVPHDYYFREMYLPQISSGPQSPTWSPDGKSLVYTMQGSLWRQDLASNVALQLTTGPGYDHQPDWSPDGKSILFSRYHNDAVELQMLTLASGKTRQLTQGGDVNLEARWSPDGARVAFVSTRGNGRFHVYTGRIDEDLKDAQPLVKERQSEVPRYYYSSYDHELSPVWTPDGRALLIVANPETPYGSGSLWRQQLDSVAPPVLVRGEETSWRARPDVAPDGRRVIYSSYLGRQWHQLWITAIDGKGEPFPLTYGDYDVTSARWSPDGEHIAMTVNEHGNTAIRVIEIPGGRTTELSIQERKYLRPTGKLHIAINDDSGKAVPARVSVTGADGRAYAPHDRWAHADDGFDREQRKEEAHYFHAFGDVVVDVPEGLATITVWRGPESQIERRKVTVRADTELQVKTQTEKLALPESFNSWYSADVHVHMNYGGVYRNTPENLARQAAAEDLDVVFNLIVNKEQRVPDVHYFSGKADAQSNSKTVLQHSQEFHTSYWGHLGLLGLSEHLLLPDYSAYPETAAASIYPDNPTIANHARRQGALVGYVHPFAFPIPNPATDEQLTNALPVDAALGNVDYYEVVGFADHRASAEVWYRLLNCGMRIAAAGGTDAMANYASLRGPLGINRTYVQSDNWPAGPDERRDTWLQALKAGRSIATNGPLLGFSVQDAGPGSALQFDGQQQLDYRGFVRSAVPLDKVEVIQDGKVIALIKLSEDGMSADFTGTAMVGESGWLLLRASASGAHPDVFDLYPYATTTPVYVNIGENGPRSTADANYFLAWIARSREAAVAHESYNSDAERERVLRHIDDAIAIFEARRD